MSYIPGDEIADIAALITLAKSNPKSCAVLPRIPTKEIAAPFFRMLKKGRLYWNAKTRRLLNQKEVSLAFLKCRKKKVQIIFGLILLANKYENSFHNMAFLYNLEEEEVEIFDPVGGELTMPHKFLKKSISGGTLETRDEFEMDAFRNSICNFFYHKVDVDAVHLPYEFCPVLGIQALQEDENIESPQEVLGYCMAWSVWWIWKRLKNPKVKREVLMNKLLDDLKNRPYSLTSYIRSFAKKISENTKYLMVRSLMEGSESRKSAKKLVDDYWKLTLPILELTNEYYKTPNERRKKKIEKDIKKLYAQKKSIFIFIHARVYRHLNQALKGFEGNFVVL